MNKKTVKKEVIEVFLFCGVMLFTFYYLFKAQNLPELGRQIRQLSFTALLLACILSLFFIMMEGTMIWYLLGKTGKKNRLIRCIGYSFSGFFFSGLTPSATGGQPVQLYYMNKDGNSMAASSVVLMTVAVIYKFVLAVIGCALLLFEYAQLKNSLKSFFGLYLLGLALNILLVIILLFLMFSPSVIKRCYQKIDQFFCWIKLWKRSETREQKVDDFLEGYRTTVSFLKQNKKAILVTIVGTFFQRSSMFVLTYVIYRGLGLSGASFFSVVLLQAAVYIAVDMLPVPGAQGITEAMYRGIFGAIFPGQYLLTSVCITRGINFYLMMLISFFVWWMMRRKARRN